MTTATNVANLRQYKRKFSLTAEEILPFASSTNLVTEIENLSPNFKRLA